MRAAPWCAHGDVVDKWGMKMKSVNVIFRNRFSTSCLRNKENNYFITTPIFYVNASPHIGHLYSAVLADASNRFQNLLGNETVFTTGTDEHGTKIQQAAEKYGTTPLKYCGIVSQQYKDLFQQCNIEYSDFIRTTEARHRNAVYNFWDCLKSRGHIYSGTYAGWYCVQDEAFLTDAQLVDGPNGSKVSAESGHPVEWTKEENFKFNLSDFKEDLLYWLKDPSVVKPAVFHRRLVGWLSDDSFLQDLSVSRPSSRVHWGLPVPDHADHTIYVWFDALVNYLTVAGYPDSTFNQRWPPDLQVIGKDILKFHGIYWPAFLIAAGMEPPRTLLCHSHWTVDAEKMSKSRGNVVDPFDRVERYTSSGLRYFLLREGVAHSDGNYSDEKVTRILNSELADTLGNLLSRCCGPAVNPRQHFPQCSHLDLGTSESASVTDLLQELPAAVETHYRDCNFYRGIDLVVATLHAANKLFESEKPWRLARSDPERLEAVLYLTMEALRVCGILLQPVVPVLAGVLLSHLGVPRSRRSWFDSAPFTAKTSAISNEKLRLYSKIIDAEVSKKV